MAFLSVAWRAVRDSSTTAAAALEFLTEARKLAKSAPQREVAGPGARRWPNAPAATIAQACRESSDRQRAASFLEAWAARVEQLTAHGGVRWALDVIPIELF